MPGRSQRPFLVLAAPLAAVTLSVAVSGCSGEPHVSTAPVQGKVTYDGKPVEKGEVLFVSETGFAASAALDSEGRYALASQYGRGIPPGKYKVAISPPPAKQVPGSDPPAALSAKDFPDIPKKYWTTDGSGLTASVTQQSKDFDFELKEK